MRRDQLVAQETQERALQSAYGIAERRYNSGISSYLDLLDSQRSLFNAQIARVQTERLYLQATVLLFRALGGNVAWHAHQSVIATGWPSLRPRSVKYVSMVACCPNTKRDMKRKNGLYTSPSSVIRSHTPAMDGVIS